MLELTGIAPLLRAMGVLYWLLALAAVIAALYFPRTGTQKAVAVSLATIAFAVLPVKSWIEARERAAYAEQAWAHFRKLCAEKAGEKIYKTYSDVRSVLVIGPLPPAVEKDLYDQFWYGDPYSDATPWNRRGEDAARRLVTDSRRPTGLQRGLDFVEIRVDFNGDVRHQRISRPQANDSSASVELIETPESRFSVSWEDISSPADRQYWVAGSRLRILDSADDSIVAERVGYLIEAGFGSRAGARRPWLSARGISTTCPPLSGGDYSDQWFIRSVLQ